MKAKSHISGGHAASASDVARRAGVSRSAVSRTFTDGASVSPDTRAKVLRAAEELHYHVNFLGSGLIDHNQKMTTAAIAIADMKVCAQRS